jgi:autotransporter-associated beta strand protein
MKFRTLLVRPLISRLCVVAAAAALFTSTAVAQTTWTGSAFAPWSSPGNWSAGLADGAGVTAVIDGTTSGAVFVDGVFTVGNLDVQRAPGILDSRPANSGAFDPATGLTLDNGEAVPTITNTGDVFVYTTLRGTQGFRKLGAGRFTFRFNTLPQDYSGPILIEQGVLGINADYSLGNANNDITIEHVARLTAEPGANSGIIVLPDTRALTLNGAFSQIGASHAAVTLEIEGPVSGTGGLTKVDAGRLVLKGDVTYQGATRVVGGSVAMTNPSSNLSHTGELLVRANPANQLDLAALAGYTMNSPSSTFVVHPNTTASGDPFTVEFLLPKSGTSSITASGMTVGGANGSSQGNSHLGALRLGQATTINANAVNVGGFNGRGAITMQEELVNPSVTIRGTDGISRVTTMTVGATSSGVRSGEGDLALSGATVDALADLVVINQHVAGANNAAVSSISVPSGTFDTNTLVLGEKRNGGIPVLSSNFNHGAAANVKVGSLILGRFDLSGANPVEAANFASSYNLSGGTLTAGSISAGPGVAAGGSNRRIGWTGGVITHLPEQDLLIDGTDEVGGLITVAASTTAAKSFHVEADRTITLGANTQMTAFVEDVVVTKTGPGALVVGGDATAFVGVFQLDGGSLKLGVDNAIYTLNAAEFVWNDGRVHYDLAAEGVSDSLAVFGALTKGLGSSFVIDLGGSGVAGETYTLATFASTSFSLADFSAVNLPNGVTGTFELTATELKLALTGGSGDDAYALWAGSYLLDPNGNGAPGADPDGDGLVNLIEYALGGNPSVPDAAAVTPVAVASGSPARLAITFGRIADPLLTYSVRAYDSLTDSGTVIWTSSGSENVAGPVTVSDVVEIAAAPRRFLRLEVSR